MCTIIVLHRAHQAFPLIVAANRDEFLARPASGPLLLCDEPRVIGGRDLKSGGTWLGACETGLFVGLTNQRTYAPADPSLRSRGQIVLEALRRGTLEAARAYLADLDARSFNSFNLIFGDASELWLGYGRSDSARLSFEQPRGPVCVLANDRLGSAEFPKTERAAQLVRGCAELDWPELALRLKAVLGDHELPPEAAVPEPAAGSSWPRALLQQLQALCIHTPSYGTRSATIAALEPGRVAHYLFAAGPPCTTAFEDVTFLLGANMPLARR